MAEQRNNADMALTKIGSVELAQYVLARSGPMTHLKLQKLLYYAQAWHLACLEEPIIDDDFEAWMHGPVCAAVWHHFKNEASPLYNEVGVPAEQAAAIRVEIEGKLVKDQVELVGDVLAEYGDKTAYYLECLTHSEDPWVGARAGLPADAASSTTISKESIKAYYSRALYGEA